MYCDQCVVPVLVMHSIPFLACKQFVVVFRSTLVHVVSLITCTLIGFPIDADTSINSNVSVYPLKLLYMYVSVLHRSPSVEAL